MQENHSEVGEEECGKWDRVWKGVQGVERGTGYGRGYRVWKGGQEEREDGPVNVQVPYLYNCLTNYCAFFH